MGCSVFVVEGKEQEAGRSTQCSWSFSSVPSTHFSLTQASSHLPTTQRSKEVYISSTRRPRGSLCKCSYREKSELLGTIMQSTTVCNVYKYSNLEQAEEPKCLSPAPCFFLFYTTSLHLLSYLK